jgi:hypothetical protein
MERIAKFKECQKIDASAIWGGVQVCWTHNTEKGATQTPCGSPDDLQTMTNDGDIPNIAK